MFTYSSRRHGDRLLARCSTHRCCPRIQPTGTSVALTPGGLVEIDTARDSFGTIRRSTLGGTLTPHWGGLQPLAGGRYLVSKLPGVNFLNVIDTRVGTANSLPVAGDLLALDTHRPRIFLADASRTVIVDARTGSVSSIPIDTQAPFGALPAAYAGLPDRLFVARNNRIDIIDVAAGAVVQTINTDVGATQALATDAARTRVFALSIVAAAPLMFFWHLSAFDTQTGR